MAQCALAGKIVDSSKKLETISRDFNLADGPAWDGAWSLYVLDVNGEKLFRYVPKIVKNGKTSGGRVLAEMDSGPDKGADGMCIDRAKSLPGRQARLLESTSLVHRHGPFFPRTTEVISTWIKTDTL